MSLSLALSQLRAGKIICYPTDTLPGLAVDAGSEEALRLLFRVKGRSAEQPVVTAVADLAQAEQLAEFSPMARQLAEEFWPGALTLLLPSRGAPSSFLAKDGWRALRVPADPFSRALAKEFPGGLTTTSANRSGQSALKILPELRKEFAAEEGRGEILFFGEEKDFLSGSGRPSTLAKALPSGEIEILREGELTDKIGCRFVLTARSTS
jgi:tRNA threonylcarbamoyl adenosine modification protein (Sua5/YciO/YrdC/YwlC family)